jgi:hypothetical protein
VTNTNIECANTELRRAERYRLDALHEIIEHCDSHDCATPEMEEICGHSLGSGKRAVA